MKKLIFLLLFLSSCVHFEAEKIMLKAGFTEKVYNESETAAKP